MHLKIPQNPHNISMSHGPPRLLECGQCGTVTVGTGPKLSKFHVKLREGSDAACQSDSQIAELDSGPLRGALSVGSRCEDM